MADPGDSDSELDQPVAESVSSEDDLLDDGDERLRKICDEYHNRLYDRLQADGFTASTLWAMTVTDGVKLGISIRKVLEDMNKTEELVIRIDTEFSRTETRDLQLEVAKEKQKQKHLPQPRVRDVESARAMASLKKPYHGNAHETMYAELCHLSLAANSDLHYSCYSTIVQSSGTGKSRGVLEMSRLGVYICYCSTAPANSTACPPRSGELANQLSWTCNELEMACYFKAWLSVLVDEAIVKKVSPEEWMDSQLNDTCPIRDSVLKRWKGYRDGLRSLDGKVQEDYDVRNLKLFGTELKELQNLPPARGNLKILLVFDEARGLLPEDYVKDNNWELLQQERAVVRSPFYQMRRVSRAFFTNKHAFSVCIDTTTKITNMHLSASEEHSRKAKVLGTQLLRPVYQMLNMQLVTPTADLSPEKVFRIGRPLWSSFLDRSETTVESFLAFVQRKLISVPKGCLGGVEVDVYDTGVMAESQAIALLSVTAGLEICPRSVVSQVLVASHTGIVTFISIDGSRVHVSHAVEPAVSEAAAKILNRNGGKPFVAAVEKLKHAFFSGYCGCGDEGEFVCKTLLLMAVWRLRKQEGHYLTQFPVREYLVSLLGFSKDEVNSACEGLPEESYVFFNSFMLVKEKEVTVTEDTLAAAYLRGCAIHFKAGRQVRAVDFLLPVSTPKGMTCIVGCGKSVRDAGNMRKQATEELNPRNVNLRVSRGLKVLTLFINVSEPKKMQRPLPAAMFWKPDQLSQSYRKAFNPKQVAHTSLFGLQKNFRGFTLDPDGRVKERTELTEVEIEARKHLQELLESAPDTEVEAGLVSARAAEYVLQLVPDVSALETLDRAEIQELFGLAGAQLGNRQDDSGLAGEGTTQGTTQVSRMKARATSSPAEPKLKMQERLKPKPSHVMVTRKNVKKM